MRVVEAGRGDVKRSEETTSEVDLGASFTCDAVDEARRRLVWDIICHCFEARLVATRDTRVYDDPLGLRNGERTRAMRRPALRVIEGKGARCRMLS